MKKSPLFVIWGYGNENVFLPFAEFLRTQGYEVLILPDAGISKKAELERLLREPFILLTSSHFTRDTRNLARKYPDVRIETDFLEILYHAKPVLSVFYPHDLVAPLVSNEPVLLSAFDLVLWPTPFFGHPHRPRKFYEAGWISFRGEWIPPQERTYDCVWFFSEFDYYFKKYGVHKTHEKLAPILEHGVAIKFPHWPGHKEFEQEFKARGVTVIPAEQSTGDMLRHCRVAVANGLSGIVPEAAFMGTPVIVLPSDWGEKTCQTQRELFSLIPGAILSRFDDFASHLASVPSLLKPRVKPFDPQQVLDIILTEAASKQGNFPATPLPQNYRIELDDFQELRRYDRWVKARALDGLDVQIFQEHAARLWKKHHLFEFCLVLKPGMESHLANSIDSIPQQYYEGWRLTIFAQGPSPEEAFTRNESVVRWLHVPENAALADFINAHLSQTPAHWLAFFECGTCFAPQLLLMLSDYLAIHPEWRAIYTDEDRFNEKGERNSPAFKPDFNLEFLRSADYIGGLFVERNALLAAGGYPKISDAAYLDIALRIADVCGDAAMGHISDVLVHLPEAVSPCATEGGAVGALREHLARRGIAGEVCQGLLPSVTRRIVYHHDTSPLVSIIVPTKNRLELIQPCVESLFQQTRYPHWELLLVDNGSDDPAVLAWYETLPEKYAGRLRLLHYDAPFNYSAMNNLAAREARGDYLLLLNNDTECIHDDWLDAMMSHAQRPDVGIVGARLLFPESLKIQHAGVFLGGGGYAADHVFLEFPHEKPGYLNRAQADQEYSAVTGACLLIRTSIFMAVGMLDELTFQVMYNDADLCLKVRQRGYRILWTPFATLLHKQSASLRSTFTNSSEIKNHQKEGYAMTRLWRRELANDPAWNRHLSLRELNPTIETELAVPWNPDFHDRPRILCLPTVGLASEYRCLAPLAALRAAGKIQYAAAFNPQRGALADAPKPIELARAAPDTLLMHNPLNHARSLGQLHYTYTNPEVFLIYTMDDLLSNVPLASPAHSKFPPKETEERIAFGLKYCHRLIVSTEPLAEAYRDMIEDIVIMPNTLPREVWGSLSSRRRQGKKLRVGWAGAQQHAGDLRFLLDVVEATRDEVDWVFMGMKPEGIDIHDIEFHDFERFSSYPAKLASLDLDLAVAPLEMHPFNEAKSNLRLLEFGILGWPVICTDIFPFRTHNPPVTRLPNEAAKWIAAIRERVADPDALAKEGDAMRAWVQNHYLLENHLDQWLAALTRKP